MTRRRWAVGLDLGTTNCCMARAPRDGREPGASGVVGLPEVVPVAQLVAPDAVEARHLLPSFLYLPSPHETPDAPHCGVLARDRGAGSPDRLIHSAKSWLCAPSVDRRAPILPWRTEADVERRSPVAASAAYLDHLRRAFDDRALAEEDEPLALQDVVVTVPASFDAVARQLTVEAAREAGLPRVVLLEEPLAAFYAWLAANGRSWRSRLRHRRLILVCDVGGGTTDFSLIAVSHRDGVVTPERVAVGDHLLAGGDNMDRLLAHLVEERLMGREGTLDPARFATLTAACRTVKESLLLGEGPDALPVTVLGRGSALIGGTLSTELTRAEVRVAILDTFFPATTVAEARLAPPRRSGLMELGLPYAPDPAVTRNLARFLAAHDAASTGLPDAVLFNGGSLHPPAVRDRILSVVRSWRSDAGLDPDGLRDLTGDDLDRAVARGAAVYACARAGQGLRVGASLRRSYYVGFGSAGTTAAAGAVCVVPASAEEGETFALDSPSLEAVVGRPVRFDLFTATTRDDDEAGTVASPQSADLSPLPPLVAVVTPRPGTAPGTSVPVRLRSRLDEVGTLSLALQSPDGADRFELTFELREATPSLPGEADGPPPSAPEVTPARLARARTAMTAVFTGTGETPVPPRKLAKAVEATLDRRRTKWSVALCRELWAVLDEGAKGRRRSADHEESWFTLTGYALRPGFGAPLDEWRVERTLPLLTAGLQHKKVTPVRIAWWVFWRRVAGGLSADEHRAIFEQVANHVLPGKAHLRRGPQPDPQELSEMLRLAASLEGVEPSHKRLLGDHLLDLLANGTAPRGALWAVARLGARVPFSPRVHAVLPPWQAADWLDRILKLPWGDDPAGVQALVALARRTDERDIDVPDALRRRVLTALTGSGMEGRRLRPLEETILPGEDDEAAAFGEELPPGLVLAPAPTPRRGAP